MLPGEKVIQSFTPHGFVFMWPGRPEMEEMVTIPAGFDKRNIVVVNDEKLNILYQDRQFKALLEKKMVRVLDSIPRKYADPQEELVQARGQLNDMQNIVQQKDRSIAEMEAQIALLKREKADLLNGGKV